MLSTKAMQESKYYKKIGDYGWISNSFFYQIVLINPYCVLSYQIKVSRWKRKFH